MLCDLRSLNLFNIRQDAASPLRRHISTRYWYCHQTPLKLPRHAFGYYPQTFTGFIDKVNEKINVYVAIWTANGERGALTCRTIADKWELTAKFICMSRLTHLRISPSIRVFGDIYVCMVKKAVNTCLWKRACMKYAYMKTWMDVGMNMDCNLNLSWMNQ